MRIIVTGSDGRLGSRLAQVLGEKKHTVAGVDINDFDIVDFAVLSEYVALQKPELIIHCAAWTDVDGCARDPEKANRINGTGTENMARAAADVGAAILYVSTNEVFNGKANIPYAEDVAPDPINPYGYSKWLGEVAVKRCNPRHYIVRTAWLFAHGGKNFLQTIIGAAQAGNSLRVVVNEVANPTYNDDLAAAIAQLIETERYGIYHLTNAGSCSRYDFARYILDHAGFADIPITPITSQMWPRPSTPPEYSPLDNRAGRSLGITLRDWHEAVDAFLAKEGLAKK